MTEHLDTGGFEQTSPMQKVDEIENLLGYTKRLTAHLEKITYVTEPRNPPEGYIAAAPCGTSILASVRMPEIKKEDTQ